MFRSKRLGEILISLMVLAVISIHAYAQPIGMPHITITQPMNGSSIPAGDVTVMVSVTDFNLSNNLGSANEIGTGHIHYYMDVPVPNTPGKPAITAVGTYVPTANESYTWENVQPGNHDFSAQLVNNDHTPLIPLVYETVNITVIGNNTTAIVQNQTTAQSMTHAMAQNITMTQNQTMARNLTAAQNWTMAQNVSGVAAQAIVSSGKVIIGIMARNMAFNTSTITVTAGSAVTINFNNQDSGIYHNIAIYADASANNSIFIGMPVIGRSTIAYSFTAPSSPGTYFFRDNAHPKNMTGQFIVR
jgi:plastocyanin